ncbi:MAG: membrane protein [Candidatus Binatia bacterium]|nr:MAG: membrane protein [Candidatus Binatia bacterium]
MLAVRRVFLGGLAAVYLAAFVSLAAQLHWLVGSQGLLPAEPWLAGIRGQVRFWQVPTVFWLHGSDRTLHLAAAAGAAASLALLWGVFPKALLLFVWAIYLSFVSVGRTFFAFQWDNLLLETTVLAAFVAPWSRQGFGEPPPAAGVFLLQWLLVRLHVESGLAKILSGDPSWRDLTALATYYETAPLPTPLAWFAHQLPLFFHKAAAVVTLVAEIMVPWGIWGPRWLRRAAVSALALLQLLILATANYGFFNYLTLLLCLWGLDDQDLFSLARPWALSRTAPHPVSRHENRWGDRLFWVFAILWVPFSVVPFFGFLPATRQSLVEFREAVAPWRVVNAYHLFASMTYDRYEAVIEGSDDARDWHEYEFRYKPGDVFRAPPWVAPHQPRVDFQMWFLLLRGRAPRDPYFHTLLFRLLTDPTRVAPLFARNPFGQRPPRWLRVVVYRYRFTDWSRGWESHAWWERERMSVLGPISREMFLR